MDQKINPVFRSLNRQLTVLGVERKLFFVLVTVCFALFIAANALAPAVVLFVLLWGGARLATRADREFLRIALNSRMAVRYDPAKFSAGSRKGA